MSALPTKVLLVDDDEEDYIIVSSLLARVTDERFELDWVQDFDSARTSILSQSYDAYLVDYLLGPDCGLDLLELARKEDLKRPMIVLTNHDNHELDKRAIGMGAADYLPKRELTPALLERSVRHAIERTQLMERLYYQATHDELTGLYNRKYILENLQNAISSARRHGFPLCFCLCDIDFFKEINDSYGHTTGDHVLARFGEILFNSLRVEDIAGRYGGDEFCVIFPHISPHEARICTERIRTAVASEVFKSGSGMSFNISGSFGISFLEGAEVSPKELITAADKALYLAKERGRNQVIVQG